MENGYKYMVATRCMTYNHAQFIEDTLRGFSIQDTDFPVVFIVVDDASIDGEPEVIKRWADKHLVIKNDVVSWQDLPYGKRLVAPLKGKPHMLFVLLLLNENHFQKNIAFKKLDYISEWFDNAKYCALCEGDDFWTLTTKLQLQVNLLEQNADVSICSGEWKNLDEQDEQYDVINKNINKYNIDYYYYNINDWSYRWLTKTLTVVYRSTCFTHDEYIKLKNVYHYYRDIHVFYHLLRKGRGIFVNEFLGVYRCHEGGNYSSISEREKRTINYLCFKELYEINKDESTRIMYYDKLLQLIDEKKSSFSRRVLLRDALDLSNSFKEKIRALKHYILN